MQIHRTGSPSLLSNPHASFPSPVTLAAAVLQAVRQANRVRRRKVSLTHARQLKTDFGMIAPDGKGVHE